MLDIQSNTAAALIRDFEKYCVLTLLSSKKRNRSYGFTEYMSLFKKSASVDLDTPMDTPTDLYLDLQLLDWKVKQLVTRFSGVLSRSEIQSLLELKDTEHLRKQYTLPSLKAGYIEMVLPDKPSSKLQKYRLTAKEISLRELIKYHRQSRGYGESP